MSGDVVKKLLDTVAGSFGWFGFLTCHFIECNKNGEINSAGIVEEATDDLLDVFLAVFVEPFTCVDSYGILGFGAVFDRGRRVWAMLWAFLSSCLYFTSCFGMHLGMEIST